MTTPASDVLAVCRRTLRPVLGHEFGPGDRARLVDALEGEPATMELPRRALLFLALRDKRAFVTGDPADLGTPLAPADIVALSFLLGVAEYSPALDHGKTAAELLGAERRTLGQQAQKTARYGAAMAGLAEAIMQGVVREAIEERRFSDAASAARVLADLPHPRLPRRN